LVNLVKICFLIDENLSPRVAQALRNMDAEIEVLRVGDPGAPPLGALDPDILNYLHSKQCALVTDNRTSMPEHLAAHIAAGRHHGGIFWIRPTTSFKALVNALFMIWATTKAQEWVDCTDWLPY